MGLVKSFRFYSKSYLLKKSCLFKPLEEISYELKTVPELLAIVGEPVADAFIKGIKPNVAEGSADDTVNRKLLQKVFEKIMASSKQSIQEQVAKLVQRTIEQPEALGAKLSGLIQKMVPEDFSRSGGDGKSILYNPPIEEFAVLQTILSQVGKTRKFNKIDGPSILIVTNGAGSIKLQNCEVEFKASTGNIFFIAPDAEVVLKSTENNFISYRAFVEA